MAAPGNHPQIGQALCKSQESGRCSVARVVQASTMVDCNDLVVVDGFHRETVAPRVRRRGVRSRNIDGRERYRPQRRSKR